MGIGEAAFSSGDMPREIRELRDRVDALESANRLEAASIGSGGLRIHRGGGLRVHQGGSIRVEDGGDVEVLGGRIVARDADGQNVFIVTTDPASIFMREELITELARRIISQTVHAATVSDADGLDEGSGSDTGYVDLDPAGPSITFDTQTGKWIVLIFAKGTVAGHNAIGRVSYEATGDQSVPASDGRSSQLESALDSVSPEIWSGSGDFVTGSVHTGLPGTVTVTVKYKLTTSSDPGSAGFQDRTMVVIAF